jgi:hypothetical protein
VKAESEPDGRVAGIQPQGQPLMAYRSSLIQPSAFFLSLHGYFFARDHHTHLWTSIAGSEKVSIAFSVFEECGKAKLFQRFLITVYSLDCIRAFANDPRSNQRRDI